MAVPSISFEIGSLGTRNSQGLMDWCADAENQSLMSPLKENHWRLKKKVAGPVPDVER
jgi:hypothetical protein